MKSKKSKAQWQWMFLVLILVFSFCQSSFIQAAFNPQFLISTSQAFAGKASDKKKTKEANKEKAVTKKKSSNDEKKDPFYANKTLKKIYYRQAKRASRIRNYKIKGVIGEADDGLLKIRDSSSLKKEDKLKMEKIVKVENSDRNRIFKEVEKGIPSSQLDREANRRHLFKFYHAGDETGMYYFQADHWMKH